MPENRISLCGSVSERILTSTCAAPCAHAPTWREGFSFARAAGPRIGLGASRNAARTCPAHICGRKLDQLCAEAITLGAVARARRRIVAERAHAIPVAGGTRACAWLRRRTGVYRDNEIGPWRAQSAHGPARNSSGDSKSRKNHRADSPSECKRLPARGAASSRVTEVVRAE